MDDDLDLPVKSGKSPFRAMEKVTGIPPRLDVATMLIARGATAKAAAAAAGCSPTRVCQFLREERGRSRMNFWLAQELRALAPKAIKTLDKNLGSKNAMASVRSAESILDRVGLDDHGMKGDFGGLTVIFDFGGSKTEPKPEKVIEHE